MEELIKQEVTTDKPIPKTKKQIALKVIATFFSSLITILAYTLNVLFIFDTAKTFSEGVEGWEGLGVAIVMIVSLAAATVALILYQIPVILSIIGFGVSFGGKKKNIKRQGKIYFSVLFFVTILCEIILAIMTAALVLSIYIKMN